MMPRRSRDAAVAGPTAAMVESERTRVSFTWRKYPSTPLALVKITKSAGPIFGRATKRISMVGARITSAPRIWSRWTRSPACSRARVTMIRFPKSGRFSIQSMRFFATSPTIVIAGGSIFAEAIVAIPLGSLALLWYRARWINAGSQVSEPDDNQ